MGEKRASRDRKHVSDHRGRGHDYVEQGHGSGVQGHDHGGRSETKVMEGGLVIQHLADPITGARVVGGFWRELQPS